MHLIIKWRNFLIFDLQWNDMIEGKYQDKNLIRFYKYAQLKAYTCVLIPVFGIPNLHEKRFLQKK